MDLRCCRCRLDRLENERIYSKLSQQDEGTHSHQAVTPEGGTPSQMNPDDDEDDDDCFGFRAPTRNEE